MSTMQEIKKMDHLTPIQQFYEGTNIFITGGTGFFGKILLEKLLRSCSGLNTLYILIRSKKGKHLHERLDELFDDVVFGKVKEMCPKFRHKVVAIGGDCNLEGLGLSHQDKQILINEVNIIFHVAATVRFDEKLKTAVAINIRGPLDILGLAHQMPHLKSMIHVSTAFSNVPYSTIEEKFYPTPIDGRKLIQLTESIPEKILDDITPRLLDKWPNTYAFTKAIAEDAIRQEAGNLPLGISRPSIVVSSYKEPLVAWINNLYGPTGVAAGAGNGLIRTLHAGPKVNANIVPVDMCVNSIIANAWEVGTREKTTQEIPIYHYESSNDQPINWETFRELSQKYGIHAPSINAIWYYSFNIYSNLWIYTLMTWLVHFIPAFLMDGVLFCLGKTPKMWKVYKKIHKFSTVISYFATRTWHFKSNNLRNMINKMSEKDQEIFFCDLKKLDWVVFFKEYLKGIRIYLLADPMHTLPDALIKWRRLYWCHTLLKIITVYLLFKATWFIVRTVFETAF